MRRPPIYTFTITIAPPWTLDWMQRFAAALATAWPAMECVQPVNPVHPCLLLWRGAVDGNNLSGTIDRDGLFNLRTTLRPAAAWLPWLCTVVDGTVTVSAFARGRGIAELAITPSTTLTQLQTTFRGFTQAADQRPPAWELWQASVVNLSDHETVGRMAAAICLWRRDLASHPLLSLTTA